MRTGSFVLFFLLAISGASQSAQDTERRIGLLFSQAENAVIQSPETAIIIYSEVMKYAVEASMRDAYLEALLRRSKLLSANGRCNEALLWANHALSLFINFASTSTQFELYVSRARALICLDQHAMAAEEYERALELSIENQDQEERWNARQELLQALLMAGHTQQLFDQSKKLFDDGRAAGHAHAEGFASAVLGRMHLLSGAKDSAAYYFEEALTKGKRIADSDLISSSYFGLAECTLHDRNKLLSAAYADSLEELAEASTETRIKLALLRGKIAVAQRKKSESYFQFQQAHSIALENGRLDLALEALTELVKLSASAKEYGQAFRFSEMIADLKDSMSRAKAFEQISELNAFGNAIPDPFAQEIEDANSDWQLTWNGRNELIIGGIFIFICLSGWIILIVIQRRHRKKLRTEQTRAEEANTELVARNEALALLQSDLHHVQSANDIMTRILGAELSVSQGIYDQLARELISLSDAIRTGLDDLAREGGDQLPLERFLQLKNTAARSFTELRNKISRTSPVLNSSAFPERIKLLCESYAHSHFAISCVFNQNYPCEEAAANHFVFRILDELLQNAGAHSGGDSAEVKFTCTEGHSIIEVSDNGTGLSSKQAEKGDGLNRVKLYAAFLRADINVTSSDRGTTFNIRIPRKQS